jgi:hypothetical protein
MRKRILWTPDEALDMAKAMFQSAFGDQNHQSVAKAEPKQIPTLLPKPIRVVETPKGGGLTIQQLRKAQRQERKRLRFNKAVRKAMVKRSKALTEAQRLQIRAAKAAYRAAKRQERAQAQAALQRAEKAKAQAEQLRKEIEAMRRWLELEALRRRTLDSAAKERIQRAKARGFRLLSTFCSSEQKWGASCPLFAIRGLAAAAAVIWAAEQAK